jgi:hypothetical protein
MHAAFAMLKHVQAVFNVFYLRSRIRWHWCGHPKQFREMWDCTEQLQTRAWSTPLLEFLPSAHAAEAPWLTVKVLWRKSFHPANDHSRVRWLVPFNSCNSQNISKLYQTFYFHLVTLTICAYIIHTYIYIHIIHITYALVFRCTKYVSVPREWRCFVISQATFELRLAVWWFCSRRSLQICTYDFWRWCFALDHGSLFAWQTVNTNLKTNFVQYRGLAGPTVS